MMRNWIRAARLMEVGASLSARGLEAVAKFGLYALAARNLGGHDAGRFFLALSIIHLTATVCRMGLEKPLTRHVAAELGVGRPAAAARAVLYGGGGILSVSLAAAVVLASAGPLMTHGWLARSEMAPVLGLIALIIPVQNTAYAMAYVLIGLERSVAAQVVMNALTPTLCLAAMTAGVDTLEGLLAVYVGAYGICVLVGVVLLAIEARRPHPVHDTDHPPLPDLWAGARPLLVVETAQAALLSVPVLLLGAFAAPTAVSVFSLCNRLSMLVATVVLSLGAMAAPAYARHYRLGQWAALRQADRRNRLLTLAVCGPLLVVLAAGAEPLLRMLGVDPVAGTPVLWLLLAGQLVFCLLPSQDLLLAMAGEGRVLRTLSLWQLAGCTALCLAVIPATGATGAAAVSSATWMAGAVALAVAARRHIPQLRG